MLDPDSERASVVGIDVALTTAQQAADGSDQLVFQGAPVLAVEILSPSDRQETIIEKVRLYLQTGVAVVWLVDPRFRAVSIHRVGELPRMVNAEESLQDFDELPGLVIPVKDLFGLR